MNTQLIEMQHCEECDLPTFHIPLEAEDITYDPESGFVLHLTEDEVMDLRAQLRSFL